VVFERPQNEIAGLSEEQTTVYAKSKNHGFKTPTKLVLCLHHQIRFGVTSVAENMSMIVLLFKMLQDASEPSGG
jgi:hypothetical protein